MALRDALTGLSRVQRAVLVLRYLEGLTEAETADVLEVTIGTVQSQARLALAALRDHYKPTEHQLTDPQAEGRRTT